MKKNTMMRIASVLMVAVLLSTCAISSTFAKYVSSDSATDTARIAKWGVTVDATGAEAFAKSYNGAGSNSQTVTVQTKPNGDDKKVIAPGTAGSLGSITINGTPEVMVDVDVSAALNLSGWKLDENTEYCPLVFQIGSEEFKIGANGITSVAGLENAIEAKFASLSSANNIAANTDLQKSIDCNWYWPFNDNEDNNAKDTALTQLNTVPTITFECSVTVAQVD